MTFQDELREKVHEIVQVAFAGLHAPLTYAPADVWEAFEPFLHICEPESGDPTASMLRDAAHELHAAQSRYLSGIADDLREWRGEEADAFKQRLREVSWSTANAQTLLEELCTLYQAYQALVEGTQADVLRLAAATLDALRAYRQVQGRQRRQANMTTAIRVISVLTSGAGAAISVAQQGIQTAMTMRGLEVGGGDPTEIMESMFGAIGDLLNHTWSQADAIIAGIGSAAGVMRRTLVRTTG